MMLYNVLLLHIAINYTNTDEVWNQSYYVSEEYCVAGNFGEH